MASDIEQRNFVDKDGLEQFWDDIQTYMTRMYKGLPAGMQFSRIYQQNGQLHILVEPFGGDTEDRKAASRSNLGVYSKAEIDANYKTKQDGVSEQFTEYQTLLDISQDTNGEISVRKQVIPTATVGTLGLTTLKGVVSADDGDNSNAATPKAVADAIAATIAGLDVSEVSIGEAKTVGTISEVDGKIVVTAVDILVGNSNIADGAVTTDKLGNDAVTADKVKDGELLPVDISGTAAKAADVAQGSTLHNLIASKADKVANATADNFASLDANGNLKDSGHKHSDYKTVQEPVSDPESIGNTDNFEFISSVEQNSNGLLSATKHTIPKSDAIDSDSSVTLATSAAVKAAIEHAQSGLSALDVENHLQAGEYITTLSQTDGLITYDTEPMATEPVENGTAPVTSHALYVEKHLRETADTHFDELIPTQASANNQLADKAYVDAIGTRLEARYLSSYSKELDEYIPFPTYADFVAAQSSGDFYYNGTRVNKVDNNDVIVITADETHPNEAGGPSTTRYRYQCDVTTGQDGHWYFEYVINNTALNLAQLQAINSGINADKVNAYDTHIASDGKEGRQENPHKVTFDQLEGRNGVTSTELGVLDGVDTSSVGSSQLNTLAGIHIEEGVTIQSQLDDKVERVSPKYSQEQVPGYTASGKIAIIDDNADVNGRFGVEDSGAEIVANYNGNDTINPATGSAIKQAVDALDATVDSTHPDEKVLVTVTEENGLLKSVVVDDSNAATAAQGAKADTAIQTVSVLDNGDQSAHILEPDANNGVTVDLSDYKRKQDPVDNPTAQGTSLTFIDTISQDDEGVITPTRKSVTVDDDYIVDGTNPASGTAITNALHTLEATVDSTGGTNVGVQVVETNGIITGVTVSDSSINANDLNDAITALNATVDSTGGKNVSVQVVEADGVITGVTVYDNTVNTTDLANAIDALDYTDTPIDSQFVTGVNEVNGVITVERSTIGTSDIVGFDDALSAKADKVDNATAGNFATLDNTGNLVDSGKHVTSAYRDATQEEGHEKDEYLANPVTGTAVDAAIAESASSDRQYVDDKIDALDATVATETAGVPAEGKNFGISVSEENGVLTGVSIIRDDTVNAADVSNAINALDATVATETAGEPASNKNFGISVTETDGVLTGVSIIRDNTINATDLTNAIESLDANVATETADEPDSDRNFGISIAEENGVLTGVTIIRDDTVNATDVSDAISSVVNDLDAEVTSSGGTNVQFKVTEVDGKITEVNVTTDNTVNATDVDTKVATEIGKLDVDSITGFGADKTLKTLTETDGKIDATFQSILVDTANIKPDAVKTAQIADDAVTSDKIKEGEVKTANIADSAVTTAKINDSAVTTAKIDDSAVTTAKINDGAVTTDKIDVGAVTSEKIGEGEVKTINIADEAVTTAKIDNEAVTTAKIDDSAVTTAKINDSAVTTAKIDDSAVTTAKINDSAVTTAKIADDSVTNDKIADNAVDTAQIKGDAVTTAKIADDAVTNDKIADNAVDTAQINDGAVTYDKVTNDPENPFPIDISGTASTAIHADDASHADVADLAKDVQEGSALDRRIDAIEETISDFDNTKADKVTGATEGNFAGLDADGNLTDSGVNANTFKTKQTAVTKTGAVLKTLTSLAQNANGEIDATFSDIQSATTTQKGVVQLAGSIGATVASENNKAASEKAVRDAIDGVVDGLDAEVTSSDGTNVQVKVTEVDGKITAVNITTDETEDKNNKVTSWSATTTDAHYPSEKLVKDSLDEKADKVDNATDGNFAGLDANGNLTDSGHKHSDYKTKQEAVTDPTASGSTLVAIDSISQDTNGVVTATKKNIQSATTAQKGVVQLAGSIGATVASENNKAASEKAVRDAINSLDVSDITANLGVGKTITALSESDGKISATASDIQIAESQVTDLEADLEAIDDSLDTKEDKANKVTSWSAATTDTNYPSEKLVKDSLDTKVDKTTKVNGHALSGDVTVTQGDVGLGNVVNTGDSDTPVENGTTKFTTGGAYTELNKKADKTATVSNVAYDGTNKKITKTINGTTSDVVTAATLKADMALDNVANTNITVSATDGVTDNTNNVTYKYTHPTFTAKPAAAKKVGMNDEGHVVLGDSLTKADVGLGLVSNQTITVTDTSVSDGTHTFNKYVHPTTTETAAAAVKVGNDAEGHVVLGDALQKGDVGLGNVDNTSDADKPVSTAQQTALNAKLDKTAGVTAVTWDSTNKKITKTINGTTSDVVTAATLKTAMALNKSDVGLGNVTNDAQVKRSEMGVANGVATLDADGKVPSSQLPSYIDDVIEGYYYEGAFYEDSAHTVEITPESGKVYVDNTTNLTYRWGGTAYVKIASDLALGETESTAYRGDRGKVAYDHSQLTSGNPHHVTKTDVGLDNVVNTGDSATPVSGGTTKFTTGGAYTELNKKADKTATVSNVAWDATNKKLTKTINGTTSDVVTASTIKTALGLTKSDVGLGNVDNTSDDTKKANFTGSIASGNTGFVTGGAAYTELNKKADKTATVSTVTYDTTNKTITKTINGTTTDVVTTAKLKEDMDLDLVKNQAITVTSTSVSDGTNTFNKYTHPTYTSATAAAVKVGRDSTGHVVLGTALVKGDVGLGNVDNTSDDTKKANFTGAVASGNTGFPTGGDVYTAIADNGKGVEIVEPYVTTFEEMSAIVDAGKIPLLYVDSQQLYYPLYSITGTGNNRVYYFANTHVGNINNPSSDILYDKYSCKKGTSGTSWAWLPTHTVENVTHKVSSWSSTTTDIHYPTEKLVKDSLDGKASSTHTHGNITNAGALQTNDVTIASGDKLVITDSSDSNKVARASASFDGSTTTKALTQKGTFEDFAKQADIDEAIEEIPTISLVGDNHITVTSDDTTGTVTVATDLSSYTAYTAKGSATKVPQITTNSLGQVTGITEVEITGVTPAAHKHGSITNDGKIGSTANLAVVTGTSGAVTTTDLSTAAPSASGTGTAFITSVSQDSKGKISASKANLPTASTSASGIVQLAGSIGTTVSSENNKAASEKAVRDAINELDVSDITANLGVGKTITALSESDGKISATANNIQITESQVTNLTTDLGNKEDKSNKVSSWSSTTNNTRYPSEKLVKDSLDAKENTSNKVTSWQSTPDNTHYPSEKLVSDALKAKLSRTTLSVSIPGTTTRYVKMSVSSDKHHYLVFFNASMGVLHAEWLFRTYGDGGNTRTEVNYIGAPVTIRKWFVAGASGLDYYIEFVNDSSGNQTLTFSVASLDGSSLPTLTTVETVPEGYVEMAVHGTVAEQLRLARKLAVNLANTSTDTTFNGSADQTGIKVSGTLGIANGGTGKTSAMAARNALIGGLESIESDVTDASPVVFRYLTPSDSNGAIYTKTASYLWNYIKGKMSSDTGVNISGNAATATTATNVDLTGSVKTSSTTNGDTIQVQAGSGTAAEITIVNAKHAAAADSATKATKDSDGNSINATYFKSSGNVTLVSGSATKIGTQNGADVKLTLPSIPAAVSVKGDAETTYRTGQVNLTPANLGISATSTSVTVGSTTFSKYSHPAGSAPSVTGFPADGGTLAFGGTFDVNQVTTDSTSHVSSITKRTFTLPSLGTTATTAAKGNHTHTASIAADTGTSALVMTANTKYKLTAGGSTFIFTTPVDTTYSSKTAASGGTDVSLVTTGEKWTWNHKQDALTEMTTAEVSALVAAFAS